MKCQFCGHETRGPWSFCDETCEIDYDEASAVEDTYGFGAEEMPDDPDYIDYDDLTDTDTCD